MTLNRLEDFDFGKKGHPINAVRYKPEVRVSFHTEKKCYQTRGRLKDRTEELDPTYQILSVQTQKNLSSPAGAFTITLAGEQWIDRLKSNDLVVISMGYLEPGKESKLPTVMVGLIDRVRRTRSVPGGRPQTVTTITGRDFGKILLRSQLKFYPEIGANKPGAEKFFLTDNGWIDMLSIFTENEMVKGSPAIIIDKIMTHILMKLNTTEWTVYDETGKTPVPKKINVGHVMRYQLEKTDFFLPFMLTADQFEGSLWNLMERATQKPFTELFVDVRDASEAWNATGDQRVVPRTVEASGSGKEPHFPQLAHRFGSDKAKVVLAYRTTPYDDADKKRLVTHKLQSYDVTYEDLEQNDNEHYNLFWAGMTINPLGDLNLKAVMPPLINMDDVKRYGISPLEVQIEGLAVDRGKESDHKVKLEQLSGKYSAMLKAWFEKNHEYYNGTITCRGNGQYRIGQMLHYETIEREFYIEGVSQTFNVFTSWDTSLTVTRGMKKAKTSQVDSTKDVREPTKPPAPKTPSKTTPKPPADTSYTVKKGDTLWAIAGREYKKNTDWRKIWEANKDMLIARDKRNASDHGHWIYPGQRIRIPK